MGTGTLRGVPWGMGFTSHPSAYMLREITHQPSKGLLFYFYAEILKYLFRVGSLQVSISFLELPSPRMGISTRLEQSSQIGSPWRKSAA